MRVLMLGWEFPPHFSGGLGIVCYELTKALSNKGVDVTYIMPSGPEGMKADYVNLLIAENLSNVKITQVESLLTPYVTEENYQERYELLEKEGAGKKRLYSTTLFDEVMRFRSILKSLAKRFKFDVLHAHDWLTFPAAVEIKKATGKPMIAHIHATEFDRCGDNAINQSVYDIEREGMHAADLVITVSKRIKNRCVHQYGVPEKKVRVVYNAVNLTPDRTPEHFEIKKNDKIVLFLGRVTLQKGPEYFLQAAKKVADQDPNVKFIMAGSGDMLPRMVRLAAELGIGDRVIFPGFVPKEDTERLYKMADVFIMPSVSEPFGLVPLEAMVQNTPVIISKQSGVSEVLKNCIKTDFWDTDKMAQQILALLHYEKLNGEMRKHGNREVLEFNWEKPASQCLNIYKELINRREWL